MNVNILNTIYQKYRVDYDRMESLKHMTELYESYISSIDIEKLSVSQIDFVKLMYHISVIKDDKTADILKPLIIKYIILIELDTSCGGNYDPYKDDLLKIVGIYGKDIIWDGLYQSDQHSLEGININFMFYCRFLGLKN